MITEMIDQVMSAHPDISLFHIGADEVCLTTVYKQTDLFNVSSHIAC